CARPPGVFDYW
nr:immunoglobulin heavy chain junction region [Mus musculus]